jgi:tetratricopeptide (TPR) repeat protein
MWRFVDGIPDAAAALSVACALAGQTEESLALVTGAVKAFRARQAHAAPGFILFPAGTAYLAAGQVEEATNYAREALALARQSGARGIEAGALSLTAARGAEDARGYYREALTIAEPRRMRPQVAHCHFGLGKLHRRRGDRQQAEEHLTTAIAMYREMGKIYWLERAEAELRSLG